MAEPGTPGDDAVEIPITWELDLHTFRPSEIGELLPEYFRECQARGIYRVRVIHGKGTGTLREGVHRLLDRLPDVASYQYPADIASGHWGATWVTLRGNSRSVGVPPTFLPLDSNQTVNISSERCWRDAYTP